MARKPGDPRVIRLAWIRKEDYLALSSLDHDFTQESWERWETRAKNVEAGLKARGYIIERQFIDPELFIEWSRRKGVRLGRFHDMH